jgi:hypothetical protein
VPREHIGDQLPHVAPAVAVGQGNVLVHFHLSRSSGFTPADFPNEFGPTVLPWPR